MSTNAKHANPPPAPRTKGKPMRVASAPPKRSPVLLATIGAIVAGVVLVVVLVIANGLPGSKPSAALAAPAFATPTELADGRSLGTADAPIAVDVWADFQCPYCGRFTEQTESLIVPLYVQPGHVRLTFHDYAFIGQESLDAAVAARVAGDQGGKFWAYHDLLFANQHGENKGAFSRERLADIAVAVGLDRQAFLTAMNDPRYLDQVRQETSVGTGLGVNSTPTMFIDGKQFTDLLSWSKVAAALDTLVPAASDAAPSP